MKPVFRLLPLVAALAVGLSARTATSKDVPLDNRADVPAALANTVKKGFVEWAVLAIDNNNFLDLVFQRGSDCGTVVQKNVIGGSGAGAEPDRQSGHERQ